MGDEGTSCLGYVRVDYWWRKIRAGGEDNIDYEMLSWPNASTALRSKAGKPQRCGRCMLLLAQNAMKTVAHLDVGCSSSSSTRTVQKATKENDR